MRQGPDAVDDAPEPFPGPGRQLGLFHRKKRDDAGKIIFHAMIQFAEQYGLGVGVLARALIEPGVFDCRGGADRQQLGHAHLLAGESPLLFTQEHQRADRVPSRSREGRKEYAPARNALSEVGVKDRVVGSAVGNRHQPPLQDGATRLRPFRTIPHADQVRRETGRLGRQDKRLPVFLKQTHLAEIDLQRRRRKLDDAAQNLLGGTVVRRQLVDDAKERVALRRRMRRASRAWLVCS